MALNKSLICSQAAYHLGLPGFENVETESSDAAVIINRIYDWCLDSLLQEHTWNFAIKRVTLATDVATPLYGFSKQATLPSDYIREVRINDVRYPYRIENGKLLSNLTTVSLEYVYRNNDAGSFPPLFADALAYLLASRTGNALNRDKSATLNLDAMYRKALVKAKRMDAQEGTSRPVVDAGYYDSIYGGGTGSMDDFETTDLN